MGHGAESIKTRQTWNETTEMSETSETGKEKCSLVSLDLSTSRLAK
jgi:hypothetical protein